MNLKNKFQLMKHFLDFSGRLFMFLNFFKFIVIFW